MESDDLSLLEISGEDDSLLPLQPITNDDGSSLHKSLFACSPLLISRSKSSAHPSPLVSPIVGMVGNENGEKLNSSLLRDSVNKENTSTTKLELPKLSIEPQQMKRKKKGGGYNLRKSMAWDQAFLTEEGVLNSVELSMITGNSGMSSGETLSVIQEDESGSLSGDSTYLLELEENLFKKLPSSALNVDRKNDGALLPKSGSSSGVNVASPSLAKRMASSSHIANRSVSKSSSCSQPVASLSMKMPAKVNTVKAPTKESKVLQTSIPKPAPSIRSATAKSSTVNARNSKRNQIAQPAVGSQRNVGLKGSSNIVKSARNESKSGPARRSVDAKSSAQQARLNVASALEINSSTNLLHPLVTKADTGLKMNQGSTLSAPGIASYNLDSGSNKISISVPQNVPPSGGTMLYGQNQTAKPSGLRMPSPSLGFFNKISLKPKVSASYGLSQRSNQACNVTTSHIPNFSALPASGKVRDMGYSVTAGADIKIPSTITGSSVPSLVNPDSDEKMKSKLHINDLKKAEVNVPSNTKSFTILSNQQKLQSPCDDFDQQSIQQAESFKNEKISHLEVNDLQSNDNKFLLGSAHCDQLKTDDNKERVDNVVPMSKDFGGAKLENHHLCPIAQVNGVFETRDMIDNQCVEDKICHSSTKNHGAFSESQSGDAGSHSSKATLKGHGDLLSCANAVNEKSRERYEETNPCTHQADQISNNDALSKEARFPELQKCNTKVADGSLDKGSCSGTELESSHGLSHSKDTEEANDSVAGADNFCTKSQVTDAKLKSLDCILSVESGNSVLWSSASDTQRKMVVDDGALSKNTRSPSEFQKCNTKIADASLEDGCCDETELESSHGLSHSKDTEEAKEANDIVAAAEVKSEDGIVSVESGNSVLCSSEFDNQSKMAVDDVNKIVNNTNVSELKSASALCSKPPVMLDCTLDTSKTVECLHGDETLSGFIDTQFKHGIKLRGQTTSTESDMTDKDEITGVGTAGNSEVFDRCPKSGCFSGNELENFQYPTSQPSAVVQVHGDSEINEKKIEEDKQHNLSVNNHHSNYDLQPGDGITFGQQNSAIVLNDQLNSMHIDNKQSMERNHIPEASHELLFTEGTLFAESTKFVSGNIADVNLDVKRSGGRVSEISHGLFQLVRSEEENEEVAGVDATIEKLLLEDAQMDALDESLLSDSCDYNASTVKNEASVAVEDINEQSGAHPELNSSDLVPVQGSIDAYGLTLNEKLIVNNISSEELQETNVCGSVMDVVLEQSDACRSGSRSSIASTQVAPSVNNGGIDVDQNVSVAIEDTNEQSRVHPELTNSDLITVRGSLDAHELILTEELIGNNFSSEELKERNVCGSVMDVVLEQSDACENGSRTCIASSQVTPSVNNGSTDEDQMAKYPPKEEEVSVSVESESSVENLRNCIDMKFRHEDNELNYCACLLELDVSLKMSEDPFSGEANTCSSKTFCLLNEESGFSVEANQALSSAENIEVEMLKSDVLPEEAETSISPNSVSPNCEMQHGLEDSTCAPEHKDPTMLSGGSNFQDIEVTILKSEILPVEAATSISQNNDSPNSEMQHELEDATCTTEYMANCETQLELEDATEDKDGTPLSRGSIFQDIEVPVLKSDVLTEEAETSYSQKNDSPNSEMKHGLEDAVCTEDKANCHMQHELEDVTCATEDKNETMLSGGCIFQHIEVSILKNDVLPEEAETSNSQNYDSSNSEMQQEVEDVTCATEDKDGTRLSSGRIFQDIEVTVLKSDVLLEEAETSYSQKNDSPSSEMQHELDGDICTEDKANREMQHELEGAICTEDKATCERQHELEDATRATEYKDGTRLSSGSIFQDEEVTVLKSDILPKEAEISNSQTNDIPNSEMQHELEDATCATEDKDGTVLSSGSILQDIEVTVSTSDVLPEKTEMQDSPSNEMQHELDGDICTEDKANREMQHELEGAICIEDKANCERQHELEDATHATEGKDGTRLSSGSIVQDKEVTVLKSDILPKEAEISNSQKNDIPNIEMQHELEDATCATEVKDGTVLSSGSILQDIEVPVSMSDALPEEAEMQDSPSSEMQHELEDATHATEGKDGTRLSSGSIVQDKEVTVLKSDFLPKEAEISNSQKNDIPNIEMQHELEGATCATEVKDGTVLSSGSILQDIEDPVSTSDVLPKEAETSIPQKNDSCNSEMQHELDSARGTTEDKDAENSLKKSGSDKNQDNLVIKPPPHAVPFSDEWLAAFEAAGEEILTKKSGAVQNSPPDKSLPEPGPWSPVKRKTNQELGPFDCTKFTNGSIDTSPSSCSTSTDC